jgi:hypothetical protein
VKNLRALVREAHPVVLFIYFTVLWGVLTWALGFTTGTSSFTVLSIGTRAIAAILFGGFMTAYFVWQRRRSGGRTLAIAVNQSVKSGTLPADAAAETWVPLLRRKEREFRMTRLVIPIVFGLFAVLGVYLIASDSRSVIVGALCVVVCVGLGTFSVVAANRDLPKVRALIDQFSQPRQDERGSEET